MVQNSQLLPFFSFWGLPWQSCVHDSLQKLVERFPVNLYCTELLCNANALNSHKLHRIDEYYANASNYGTCTAPHILLRDVIQSTQKVISRTDGQKWPHWNSFILIFTLTNLSHTTLQYRNQKQCTAVYSCGAGSLVHNTLSPTIALLFFSSLSLTEVVTRQSNV